MLPKKIRKKIKNSVPPFEMAVMKKKLKKKSNMSRLSGADKCQGRGLIPAVSNGGNEENDKKNPKK